MGLSKQNKRNFSIILLASFLNFTMTGFMILLQKYLLKINYNPAQSGIIVGIVIIPIIIFSPIAGRLSDKVKSKYLIMFGTLLFSFSTFAFLFITRINFFIYVLRIMQGIGNAVVFTTILSFFSKHIPKESRAQGLSYFAATVQCSYSAGSFFAHKIITGLSYKYYFIFASLLGILCFFSVLLLKEEDRLVTGTSKNSRTAIPWNGLIGGFILMVAIGGAYGFVIQFSPTYLDFLFSNNYISKEIGAPYFLTSTLMVIVASRFLLGKAMDRINKHVLIYSCTIFLALSVLLITLISSKATSLIISVIFGLSYGFLYPVINAMLTNKCHTNVRGKLSGVLSLLYNSGYSGFALFMGYIVIRLNYFYAFYLLFIMLIVALIIFYFLEKKIALSSRKDTYSFEAD